MKKVLYISYDGMTDPLGQSQVLPYIIGLSKQGYEFTLLSAEKPDRYKANADKIQSITREHGIDWQTIEFTSSIPILSKVKDLNKLKSKALELHRKKNFDLTHCRSYVSVEASLMLYRKCQVPYLFDMRGFWVDERVDGGIWNMKNPVFQFAYKYYKKKEQQFLSNASQVISLTEAAKTDLEGWQNIGEPQVTVIPCAADFNLFTPAPEVTKVEARKELEIGENEKVVSYLGSIGTWYLLEEMLDFFKIFTARYPQSKFLFLTPEPKEAILEIASQKNIDPEQLIIQFAQREKVQYFMSASDLSVFFIKQCYSKISSSPTKQGEILAMGIPVITNSGIGDVGSIVRNGENGYVVSDFSKSSFEKAVEKIEELLRLDPETIRKEAQPYYDLNEGVNKYLEVYRKILG